MIAHNQLDATELTRQIRGGLITLAGNTKLGIYGTLHCKSGRRLKRENRVFFADEPEALAAGFRPCRHCMHLAYTNWKNGAI